MVEIKPFKGYRYDVEDLSAVTSPPYDVISREKQRRLLDLSPYNFVRLILGDDPGVEECRRDLNGITGCFNDWIEKGVLKQDRRASVYVYSQVFATNEGQARRTGFVSLARLEDFGGKNIYPHEKTMPKHVQDRYLLMEATKANLGMVFGVFADETGTVDNILKEVMKGSPDGSFRLDNILHELWRVDEEGLIRKLQDLMLDKNVYIADGHHRYTTALRFRDAHPEMDAAQYVMMDLVNMYDEGLVIFPTHRLVLNNNQDPQKVLREIQALFHVAPTTMERMMADIRSRKFTYGFYCEGSYHILTLKDPTSLDRLDRISPALRALDVTVLHEMILKPILGIDTEDPDLQEKINYVKGTDSALRRLSTKNYPFGFFLNAVNVDEIVGVAKENEVMPQKSTFFYPKVYSGLVLHKLT
jgi:uncharacterized protein (DUF1015 family)